MMEQEIDLRPYLQAVVRWWRWILAIAASAALLAAAVTLLRPREYRAQATVLIDPVSAQVVLDQRFTERDTFQVTSAATRRQALIDLAESPVLEARVIQALGDTEVQPGVLLQQIEVTSGSDLLAITAEGPDSAETSRLAEVWGQTYEQLVAELYAGSALGTGRIASELDEAQARYEEAQSALEQFYSQGDLIRVSQNVARLAGLLTTARDAHEQLYTQHVSRTQELDLLLTDARALRAQVERGGSATDGLAALALRLRTAGAESVPLTLSISAADGLAASREATLDELERLIAALESERDRMADELAQIVANIATGDSSAVGIDPQTRAAFEAELSAARGALEQLRAQSNALSQTVTLSLNTLAVLQTKSDEELIGQATTDVNVRYLGTGLLPRSSRALQLLVNTALAAALASFLSVVVLLAQEWGRQRRRASDARRAPQGDQGADQPAISG